jgi:hypothetical protein
MKTATGLGLLATGAILVFALRASPPGVDIHAVGWILMAAALIGLLAPPQNRGWIRRVTVRRTGGLASHPGEAGRSGRGGGGGGGGGQARRGRPRAAAGRPGDEHLPYPPYVLRDPAALASAILRDAELGGPAPGADAAATRPFLRAVTEDDVANG